MKGCRENYNTFKKTSWEIQYARQGNKNKNMNASNKGTKRNGYR